ncbi:hypothetical protein E2C01_046463 [Portunus trituberculatus]|uniref:Uncharacterized protein n=1 Tax=Portunus trituberculatus TaxID=210409 RepID=A0A5B7G140_PORTR|nr:hypothetical protein [Portunus trituberculatus]
MYLASGIGSDFERFRDYRANNHNFFIIFFYMYARSNDITLENAVKLTCVKIKITDIDCIFYGLYNSLCMMT